MLQKEFIIFRQLFGKRIFRNFSVLTISNLITQLLSVLSSIRLARLLQPDGYGFFNLFLVQASFFSIVAYFGLRLVSIRHLSRKKEDSKIVFQTINKIRLVTTALALVGLIIYNFWINEVVISSWLLFLLSLLIISMSIWDSIESIAFGNERMETTGYISVVFTLIWVASVYIIPRINFNVRVLFTLYVMIQIVKTIWFYFWIKKRILDFIPTNNYSESYIKSFIQQSKYFFILSIFTAISNQVPILLLNFQSTLDQVGLFNLGFRILLPLQTVLLTALTALYPSLSRMSMIDFELFVKRVKNLINILVIIGIWGCLCFTLFSKEVILLLYGDAYITTARMIVIQCWYTLLFGIFCTIGTVLNSFDKQKLASFLSIIYGILSFPLYFLGAKYGALGLSWAFVISAVINMIYHWIVFKKLLHPYISLRYSFSLFIVILFFISISLIVPFDFNFIIKVLIGALLTVAIIYYLVNSEFVKVITNK